MVRPESNNSVRAEAPNESLTFPEERTELGLLAFVSLFVMLNLPLFFTVNTGMDLYSFYSVGPISAHPLPWSSPRC